MEIQFIFWAIIISSSTLLFFIILPLLISFLRNIFKRSNYQNLGSSSKIRLIHSINEATIILSKQKTGAIITIVKKQPLDQLRTDGIIINANISTQLIVSLFQKKSPLHDGAIVIENNKIKYASTYYKITSKSISGNYGARHRAALGISEQSDSLTVIVSEETGKISFASEGKIVQVSMSNLQNKLGEYLKN